jgi:hypothetical protein
MGSRTASRPAHWIAENILLVPIAALLLIGVGLWAFVTDRQPPTTLSDGRIEPPYASEFQQVNAEWKITINRRGPFVAYITRQISPSFDATRAWRTVDEQITILTISSGANLEPRPFQIPRGFQWGPTVYRATVCYEMQGLSLTRIWPVCVRWPEIPFEIVPPRPPKEAPQ